MRSLFSVVLVSAALAAGSGFAIAQTPAPARPAALSDPAIKEAAVVVAPIRA